MEYLRTPDSQFENLPDYSFEACYCDVSADDGTTLRMHYLDEGNPTGQPVVLLHGEPSWSYLYRHMIPVFVEAGYRVLAPDLIGFGRSDKPVKQDSYTYQRHVDWLSQWFDQMDLSNVVLFCQDWGGLLGLRLVAAREAQFSHIVAANTILPTGDGKISDAFLAWQKYSQEVPEFLVGAIVKRGCVQPVSTAVEAAYDAPFPEEGYKAGARRFPMLVPTSPDDSAAKPNKQAWEILKKWEKPFLTLFSDGDPIMRGLEKVFQKLVPGTQGQPHTIIENAGHFLQEDEGEKIAKIIVDWLSSS